MADADEINRAAEQHGMADSEAFTANHMTVVSCEHGTIWIRLHDADGKVRAFGCFDPDGALKFSDAVLDAIGEAVTGAGECCGSVH